MSTQTALLGQHLRKDGHEILSTKEPSLGPVGAMIRLQLLGRLRPREAATLTAEEDAAVLALMFAADRLDHVYNEIQPSLRKGVTVVTDRYYLSSLAFQGVSVSDTDWLAAINARSPRPDLTVLLDVPPALCFRRMQRSRWHVELFEDPDKLAAVRESYLRGVEFLRARREPIHVIDGNRPMKEVHRDIYRLAKKVLGQPNPGSEPQLTLVPDGLG